MSSNIANQVSYLRTSRLFPKEIDQLVVEIDKAYIDTANAINTRVIGLYPVNRPVVTGSTYYLNNNSRQQTLRQTYQFTATGNVPHGASIRAGQPINCFGSFTDGTNSYGVIFGSNVAIAGQVSFYVTSTNIVILAGVGAPSITSGIIVLEWLSLA
jgi:hypothetical protein